MKKSEPGDIRRAEDGTFEYLRSQGFTLRRGYFEEWEPAATHAARSMTMPIAFVQALTAAGYDGGLSLYDLLIEEGWRPPERGYLEIVDGAGRRLPELPPVQHPDLTGFEDVERDEDGQPDIEKDWLA